LTEPLASDSSSVFMVDVDF
jgi:hypothetical protein